MDTATGGHQTIGHRSPSYAHTSLYRPGVDYHIA
jgi:hypothetical protein